MSGLNVIYSPEEGLYLIDGRGDRVPGVVSIELHAPGFGVIDATIKVRLMHDGKNIPTRGQASFAKLEK